MTRNGKCGPDPLSHALAEADRSAARSRRRLIRRQAYAYDREHHLPRLIALPRHVRSLPEPARTLAIIAYLKSTLRSGLALRARRDPNWSSHRHTALLAALGGELRRLQSEGRHGRGMTRRIGEIRQTDHPS